MSTATVETTRKPVPQPRHGVNTPVLLATVNAVGASPELGKFRFRATNEWKEGTYSVGRFEKFYGAGTEHTHETSALYSASGWFVTPTMLICVVVVQPRRTKVAPSPRFRVKS